MLSKAIAKPLRAVVARPAVGAVRCFSQDEKLAALVDGLANQQLESAKIVVPWFMKNMPAPYFVETRQELQSQHLKAVSAFRDISQNDITLKIENKAEDGTITITNFDNAQSASVLNNLNEVNVPANHSLVGVKIYKTHDSSLSIQMFTYKPDASVIEHATVEHATRILATAAELRAGEHVF